MIFDKIAQIMRNSWPTTVAKKKVINSKEEVMKTKPKIENILQYALTYPTINR